MKARTLPAAARLRCDLVRRERMPSAELDGGTVDVHAIALRSPPAHRGAVKQDRIVHDSRGLHVRVVPAGPARDARDEVRGRVRHSGKLELIERA